MLLLQAGAFGTIAEGNSLVPMSPHKWRKLVSAAEQMHLLPYISMAMPICAEDPNLHPTLMVELSTKGEALNLQDLDTSSAQLYNHWTQKSWENVKEEEMNSTTTSDATLRLLDIIIYNADAIITKDTNIEGIIALGYFLRHHGMEIDRDKLSAWLSRIGLVQIANLEGSMLIATMGFNEDELPFVNRPHHHAYNLFMNSIEKVFQKHSFSNATRLNVAMLETISNRFVRAISLVTDIEE